MEGILDKDYNNNNLIEVKINTDDLSKQYEEIKNDFKSIQESYVELKNQLDANNKFMIYRLKENNEYLIEKLTNKT
ncbi:1186_t:CDS:2 [Entrophospora sp. SA101]|nr:1186_t:CDS:2 [Entrophospora sp. SA101]